MKKTIFYWNAVSMAADELMSDARRLAIEEVVASRREQADFSSSPGVSFDYQACEIDILVRLRDSINSKLKSYGYEN